MCVDGVFGSVGAFFVGGVAWDVKRLDERADVVNVDFSSISPGGYVVRRSDGWERGERWEGLGTVTVDSAKAGYGSVFEDSVFVEVFVIFILV